MSPPRFRRNLVRWCSSTLLSVPTVKNFEISKIQDGGGRHLEKLKTRHISATVQPTLTQFGTMMHFEPLDRPDCQKFKILQIRSAAVYITTSTEYRIRYSVTMRTVQSWTCELGYGADTMFHRTYFLFAICLLL